MFDLSREELVELIKQVPAGSHLDLKLRKQLLSMETAELVARAGSLATLLSEARLEVLREVTEEIRSLACWRDPVTGQSGFNLGNDEDGEAGARMAVLAILEQAMAAEGAAASTPMGNGRWRELVEEAKARAIEWERIYGRPNYPENLSLALELAEALERRGSIKEAKND